MPGQFGDSNITNVFHDSLSVDIGDAKLAAPPDHAPHDLIIKNLGSDDLYIGFPQENGDIDTVPPDAGFGHNFGIIDPTIGFPVGPDQSITFERTSVTPYAQHPQQGGTGSAIPVRCMALK